MHGTFRPIRILLLIPLFVLVACDRGPGRDTVATAGDSRLGVDHVVDMLGPASDLPHDSSVVRAVAEFWIDYALLAHVVNTEGALDRLDLSGLVRQHVEQELIGRLREDVIQTGADISDEDLQEMYDERRPGEEVHARHILLSFPQGAGQAQQDSIRRLAEDLRDRSRAGEDFASLASEYSDDAGTAVQGGDLQYFGRGMMVTPFEDAAFALEPGEVSDVVETQFGLHIIRVEDRRRPAFEEIADQFRTQIQVEWEMEAEQLYVERVETPANVQIPDDAADLVREVASMSGSNFPTRRANQPISVYEGGSYTAGEFRELLFSQPPQLRQQIAMATDDQLEEMIRSITRDKLLAENARERGIEVDADLEAFQLEVRQEYRNLAETMELTPIQPGDGETPRSAIDRSARDLMERIILGEQDLIPLGALALPLRSSYSFEVSGQALSRVVERLEGLQESSAPPIDPAPQPEPSPQLEVVPEGAPSPEEPEIGN